MTTLMAKLRPKLILMGYLLFQLLISLAVHSLNINFGLHLTLTIATSIAYLSVALKNVHLKSIQPGYRQNETINSQTNKSNDKQQTIQLSLEDHVPSNLNRIAKINKVDAIRQEKQEHGELRLQSQIKGEENKQNTPSLVKKIGIIKSSFAKKIDDNQCVLEGEIGQGLVVDESSGFVPYPAALKEIKRQCQLCQKQQQLRVRHCISCGYCVSTFDHHCPWISNCIGEKNRLIFIIFLSLQEAQLLALGFDVWRQMGEIISPPLVALCLAVVLMAVVLSGVLLFQVYLICLNLTTWEYLRWSRIQYLSIFDKTKLTSLFNQGILANISIFLSSNFSQKPVTWLQHLSPQAHQGLIVVKSSNTDRRLINDRAND